MSQQNLGPASAEQPTQTVVQKQRLNIYTMMLVISFISLVTACFVLHYELSRWHDEGADINTSWKIDSVAPKPRAVPLP